MDARRWMVLTALVAGGVAGGLQTTCPTDCPDGKCPPKQPAKPQPMPAQPAPAQPTPAPEPPRRPRPWRDESGPVVTGRRPFGEPEPAVDLLAMPASCRKANIASKGAGCCTFRSAEYAAWWQGVPQLYGLPEWMKENGIAGGGWPEKQAQVVQKISAARNMQPPRFIQYEGNETRVIELALKTGRPASITWGGNHMLTCVYLDSERGAILDNNDPGQLHWYSRSDFVRRFTQGGGGWVFVLLAPPPPPPPAGVPAPRSIGKPPPCGKRECDCGCRDGDTCRCAARIVEGKDCPCSSQCSCGCNAGEPCRCGSSPAPKEPDGKGRTFGVQWHFDGSERYYLCGQPVSRQVVEDELTDDTGKQHLTLIGPEADRKAVLATLGPSAEKYHVQGYDQGAWQVSCGFASGPGLTVYLQDRTGKVLFRRQAAEGLIEALRRADPNYNPASDPDGNPPKPPPTPTNEAVEWAKKNWLYLAGAAVAAWFLLGKKGEPTPTPVVVPAPPAAPPVPAAPSTDALLREYILSELASRKSPNQGVKS